MTGPVTRAMTEREALLSDWKATYAEQNPHRDPETMQYTESMLALATLLRRELRMNRGVSNLRTRTLDRLAKHNATDPE